MTKCPAFSLPRDLDLRIEQAIEAAAAIESENPEGARLLIEYALGWEQRRATA